MSLLRTAPLSLASLALVASGCTGDGAGSPGSGPEVAGTSATAPLREISGPLVVAVGDIACTRTAEPTRKTCRQDATARLAKSYRPTVVLTLGDQQYESGTLTSYRIAYEAGWGSLKPITRPVPGNHEYRTPGATGYYTYFRGRQAGPPGYYSFDVGSWRVYALNTNCDAVDCARENRWLDRAMSGSARRCSAITMHHPRYSSGLHGSNASVKPFWQTALRHRTDLALAGHDHDYERFRRMNASGAPSPAGIASFVSGAGGKNLYTFQTRVAGSVVREDKAFGVLALRLGKGRYAWEYRTIGGKVVDSGKGRCV